MATRSERDELHKTIWAIANKLRGKVDGWDFKAYVLGTIFYRYISENLTNYINKMQNDGKNIQRNLLFRNTYIKKNNGFEYGLSDW